MSNAAAYVVLGVRLSVCLFPAVAVWTMHRWGPSGLRRVTIVLLAGIAVVALALSSAHFGNRLAETEGYWHIARSVLFLFAMGYGLPVVAAAVAARVMMRSGRSLVLSFLITFGVSMVVWAVAVLLWIWVAALTRS